MGAAELHAAWDSLIESSYEVLGEAACAATGLVPNWFVPRAGAELPDADTERAKAQWAGSVQSLHVLMPKRQTC